MRIRLGLRAKVQVVVATSLVFLAAVIFAFVRSIVFSSYERLETEDVRLTVERVANADSEFLSHLYEREFDWASWDDAYQFVQDGNSAFRRVNLGSSELASNKIDLMMFVQASGKIISEDTAARFKSPGAPNIDVIKRELDLNNLSSIDSICRSKGVTFLHQGLLMNVVIRPICRTNGTGSKVGWLVWGQYVTKEDLRQVANNLELGIVDLPYKNVARDPEFSQSKEFTAAGNSYRAISESQTTTNAFYTIRDFRNQPIWVQKIYVPRTIHAQGILTFKTLFQGLVIGSILFCIVLFLAIDLLFLRRIKGLAKTLGISHNPEDVPVQGNDELTDLAQAFRSTLQSLNARKAELSELNESLEATVAMRTTDLMKAMEEAERANAAKSEFLSHMSHELRTPLNAVIGFAQLIQMREIDDKTSDSAEAILKAGKHLLDLVNEILDLAKIESGKFSVSIEPVLVASPLEQAIDLVQNLADERRVTIEVESAPNEQDCVQVDQQRLMQILLNLLSNAVKYNRPGGKVRVRCGHSQPGRYHIEIEDSGFGVRDENIERLFSPFERMGRPGVEGTGLGLALSRNLAHVMGGDLTLVKSDLNGSVFAVDLPSGILTSVTLPGEPPVNLPSHAESTVIVYIEDNQANIDLMVSLVEEFEGFDLKVATHGDEGIKVIRDVQPDVILLDLNLGEIGGIDVVREMKSDPLTRAIPIIVLSADASDSQIRKLLEAGAKTYLTKPLNISLLLAELSAIQPKTRFAA